MRHAGEPMRVEAFIGDVSVLVRFTHARVPLCSKADIPEDGIRLTLRSDVVGPANEDSNVSNVRRTLAL